MFHAQDEDESELSAFISPVTSNIQAAIRSIGWLWFRCNNKDTRKSL